jgi:hypothetical protein
LQLGTTFVTLRLLHHLQHFLLALHCVLPNKKK